jgi:peptide/nickel transport system permease protein
MRAEALARPRRRRRLPRPLVLASLAFLLALSLATALAPAVAALLGQDPEAVDLLDRAEPPSADHPLGTDELGRDVLLRLLYGGRISLAVGLAGAGLTALIGAAVGLVAGSAGGAVDAFLMRLADAVISLPRLPLLVVLAAVDPAKLGLPGWAAGDAAAGVARITLIVALFGWTTAARLVRASVLSLLRRDFVTAARALGVGPVRVALRHLLPNAAAPLVVATTLAVGNIVLAESALSFLGLGIRPPVPSWGNMLTGAQEQLFEAPGLAVWPGLLIFLTVVACNLLGDALQAALAPRHR